MFTRAGQSTSLYCGNVFGRGVQEETVPLAQLSTGFQSLPLLPTSKLVHSGADSLVGGFVYLLGPCGSLQQTLLWGWEFLPLPPQPQQRFSIRGLRFYFSMLEPWVVGSFSLPSCSSQFICSWMCDCPVCNLPPHWIHQWLPCHESCPPGWMSPSLLPVWMNISSLTPWLSDFHRVQFSVSSGCFLFLNLLLSFFWLCKKAQCVYLCLHLGQKSRHMQCTCLLLNFSFLHLK